MKKTRFQRLHGKYREHRHLTVKQFVRIRFNLNDPVQQAHWSRLLDGAFALGRQGRTLPVTDIHFSLRNSS